MKTTKRTGQKGAVLERRGVPCPGCGAADPYYRRGKYICVDCHRIVSRTKWQIDAAIRKLRRTAGPELAEFLVR